MFNSKLTKEAIEIYNNYKNQCDNKRYLSYSKRINEMQKLTYILDNNQMIAIQKYNKIIDETETEKILDILQYILDNYKLIKKQK